MRMSEHLRESVREAYLQLQRINPHHELLKYVIPEEHGFSVTQDTWTGMAFVKRFRDVSVDLLDLKRERNMIDFSEYALKFNSVIFGNYLSALEHAISEVVSSD